MNRFLLFVLLATGVLLTSFIRDKKDTTIWMIGDSTMSIKQSNKFPETGWGVPFSSMFKDGIHVENRALNGRSTKSFIHQKRWDDVYNNLKKGDYVFIQFGHNDEKVDKQGTGVHIPEYKENLKRFIKDTRSKKATPILLTSIARRSFADGTLKETHGDYPQAVREVAKEEKVLLIDLTLLTNNLLSTLGENDSKKLFLHLDSGHVNYPKGVVDNTHLNEEGAIAISGIVLEELQRVKHPLAKFIKK